MNVVVLGGTRFMGKHLVTKLLADGHRVTIATRGVTPDEYGASVQRVIIDRTDPSSLQRAFSHTVYDVVFDHIAYCSNDIKALLDSVHCAKYVMVSSAAVYDLHMDTKEWEFDPLAKALVWCNRNDVSYQEAKRQAECALVQIYPHVDSVMVRFPFVLGLDDYTKRLFFYIDHIVNEKPMTINNFESQMAFVRSDEAGKFLAGLAGSEYRGAINGASEQTISVREICAYVEAKTGLAPILSADGDSAPYNGTGDYSLNTDRAKSLGLPFTPLKSWIFELMDRYIGDACGQVAAHVTGK